VERERTTRYLFDMTPPDDTPTDLLDRSRDGDAFDRLVGKLYGELRAVARGQRRRFGASDTVNTTAVVHEAYAKLGDREAAPAFADRAHFFRVAAQAMRDVIVDYARAQRREKRGGDARPASLADVGPIAAPEALDPADVLALDRALDRLAAFDAEAAHVTELRYFAGLTIEETAEALALSAATVARRWTLARAWLHRELDDGA
jgi:RNA polymerase sigma factor (TIGR02999 family)